MRSFINLRDVVYVVLLLAMIFIAGMIGGCTAKPHFSGVNAAAGSNAKMFQRFDGISDAARQARPIAGAAAPLVEYIEGQADAGKGDSVAAGKHLETVQGNYDRVVGERDDLLNDAWVKKALQAKQAVRWLIGAAIVVGVPLLWFALSTHNLPGWIAAIFAFVRRLGPKAAA